MTRDEFLAERYGPLPVERTNPVRITKPGPMMAKALAYPQRPAGVPPWESRQAWADEMFDEVAA